MGEEVLEVDLVLLGAVDQAIDSFEGTESVVPLAHFESEFDLVVAELEQL